MLVQIYTGGFPWVHLGIFSFTGKWPKFVETQMKRRYGITTIIQLIKTLYKADISVRDSKMFLPTFLKTNLNWAHITMKCGLLCSTYPIVLHSSRIRTVDYIDKGQSLWQIFQGNVIDLLRIANARTVYNDHTFLQENERLDQERATRFSSLPRRRS